MGRCIMEKKLTLKEVLDVAMKYNQRRLNTALPCKVVSFDKDTQLAVVQIMIDKQDGSKKSFPYPELEDIPVLQPFSGNIVMTFPIEEGDTGMLIFNQRNIDTFIVEGTQTVPFDNRLHDIQDAVLIMGLTHQKRLIPEYDDDGMAIRTLDNKTSIQLKQDGTINLSAGSTIIEVASDGSVSITTDTLKVNGDIEATGDIKSTGGDVVAGATSLKNHGHLSGGTLVGYSGFIITGVTGKPTA